MMVLSKNSPKDGVIELNSLHLQSTGGVMKNGVD